MSTTYTAQCWRDEGGWWIIEVPEVPGVVSEARRLDQVREQAADALGLMLEREPSSLDVQVCPHLDEHRRQLVDSVTRDSQAAQEARAAADQAAAQVRADVAALLGTGLTAREAGELLGLSAQRVSQLADRRRAA